MELRVWLSRAVSRKSWRNHWEIAETVHSEIDEVIHTEIERVHREITESPTSGFLLHREVRRSRRSLVEFVTGEHG
jgi:hypothetical protein